MRSITDARAVRWLVTTSHGASAAVTLLGLAVLAGWALHVPVLTRGSASWAATKPNTAVAFLAAGLAILLWHGAGSTRRRRWGVPLLGTIVLLLGGLSLAEYLFDRPLGIDQLLFRDEETAAADAPGRMSQAAAAMFVLLGAAILLLNVWTGRSERRPAEWAAVPVLVLSSIALLGYAYGAEALYRMKPFSSTAFPTALAFFAASAAIVIAEPERGLLRFLTSDTPGGVTGRRLLPAAVAIPAALGWLGLQGQLLGLYDTRFGVVLLVIANILCFSALVVWTSRALFDAGVARTRAERALREREEDLSITLLSIGDGVVATDREGRIAHMNPVAERLTGWSLADAKDHVLSEVFDITNEETGEQVESPVARVLREGKVVGLANHTILRARDGTRRSIADSGAPILDAAGALRGVVLVFRDLTTEQQATRAARESAVLADQSDKAARHASFRRKDAELALQRAEERLRQAQKMEAMGRLAGGIAHDFNNLLCVMLNYGSLLMEDLADDEPKRADAEEIVSACQRATELTQQLLAFSRQQVLRPRVTNLNDTIQGMSRMLRRLLSEDVELTMDLAPDLHDVDIDPTQLEQVILNLAVNARDAMPQGGRLTLQTENGDWVTDTAAGRSGQDLGESVELRVRDTGTGMDAATRARIFEPFFTTKGIGQGTGLGLATVYGIVEQSGGHVSVESAPGEGTTFCIRLRRAGPSGEPSRPRLPPLPKAIGSETILLVEDDDQVRQAIRTVLLRQGYRVLDAANGGEALLQDESHDGPIHLLLADVVMPRMSGPELAQRLAAKRPGMRVLFMSGHMDDALHRHGALGKSGALLQKPADPVTLARVVRELLDHSAAEPEARAE